MRQYRAWDKEGGFMCGVGAIDFENKKIRVRCCPDLWEPMDKFILMQSTGLKDKAGKEIFEGDIARKKLLDVTNIYEIVFIDGCYCLSRESAKYNFKLSCNLYELEIIGNKWDNPDLLKGSE
jgi:uncharacterized phage protein (TIGR01671 family)